jgi:glycosidase
VAARSAHVHHGQREDGERADPNSLLTWYQSLIRMKKTNPALAHGDNVMLDTTNTKVLSWMRRVRLNHFVEIVGLGIVAHQVRITQSAMVVDRGCLVIVVHNDQKRDGLRSILRGFDSVFKQIVRVDAAIHANHLHTG